jgi:probable DNA metabolism protein
MTNTYLYDGRFSSLIVLIMDLLKVNKVPDNIKSFKEYKENLFDEVINLNIDRKKFEHIKRVLNNKILNYAYHTFLSNEDNKEILIYNFLRYALIYEDKVLFYRKIESINSVIKISSKVLHEAHKLKGFLRFKKMSNNFYYAKVEPTNNVIGILAKHFKNRLNNQCWIINDSKRHIYALYDMNKIIYLNENDILKLNLNYSYDELFIEELWKTFFKTIGIKERENRRCQMNFMPKKYWNNMIEMESEI